MTNLYVYSRLCGVINGDSWNTTEFTFRKLKEGCENNFNGINVITVPYWSGFSLATTEYTNGSLTELHTENNLFNVPHGKERTDMQRYWQVTLVWAKHLDRGLLSMRDLCNSWEKHTCLISLYIRGGFHIDLEQNGIYIWATVKLGDTLAFFVKPCCSCRTNSTTTFIFRMLQPCTLF